MKKIIQIILIITIAISFIIFLKNTDIHESLRQIKKLNYNLLYIFFSTFLSYILGTFGWKCCIDAKKTPSLPRLFALRHICNIITVFNPSGAVAGEIFNADMLVRSGISKDVAYKSVLMSRLMMIISQLSIFLAVIIYFLFGHTQIAEPVKNALYIAFGGLLVVIALLSFFILKGGKEKQTIVHNSKWQYRIHRIKEVRLSLAKYIKERPQKATLAFIFFTFHWVIGSLELYFIINALGYKIGILDTLFLDTLIVVSKSAVAFIPGQIGAEELINRFALYIVNLTSASLWLSVSIIRRARQMFWSFIAFLFYLGIKK